MFVDDKILIDILLGELDCEVVKEYKFCPTRKFLFDYAILSHKIAIEYEGYGGKDGHVGRHRSFKGFAGDIEKYNLAASLGWRVYRVVSQKVAKSLKKKIAIHDIIEVLKNDGVESKK